MGNSSSAGETSALDFDGRPCREDEVQVAATEILRIAGVAAYHTSVVLCGREYYFDGQGIISAPAFWSHLVGGKDPDACKTEVISMGQSLLSGHSLVQYLTAFFQTGTYDILCKNCNSFSDAAVYFLTRRRIPARFSRLERVLLNTRPLSMNLLNALLSATLPEEVNEAGDQAKPVPYTVNPLADGFSVQEVMAACDALDAEAASDAGGDITSCVTCSLGRWDPGAPTVRPPGQRRCPATFIGGVEDELLIVPMAHETVSAGPDLYGYGAGPGSLQDSVSVISVGDFAGTVVRAQGYQHRSPPASLDEEAAEMEAAHAAVEEAMSQQRRQKAVKVPQPRLDVDFDAKELEVAKERGLFGQGVGWSCMIAGDTAVEDDGSSSTATASSPTSSSAESTAGAPSWGGRGSLPAPPSEGRPHTPPCKVQEDRWHSLGRATKYANDVHRL